MAENETLFDELIEESLDGATKEERFAAKLANASPQEFAKISRMLCNAGDEAKARAAAEVVTREQSEEEQRISKLNDADFNAEFPGRRLETTLSGAMKKYRQSLGRDD